MTTIADNLKKVKDNIAAACWRSGRDPSEIKLVVVTKSADIEQIKELIRAGHTELGESRAQRLEKVSQQISEFLEDCRQQATLPDKVNWHMIGHLQRNKVKKTLPLACMIHSLDSLRLAEEINDEAEKLGTKAAVLLQVNASKEARKYGVHMGAAVHLAEHIQTMGSLKLRGLMTMAPLTDDQQQIRDCFRRLRELFLEMRGQMIGGQEFTELSMGMSQDYELAVEEGATMLRVGSAVFRG